jgi:hypothetical protein
MSLADVLSKKTKTGRRKDFDLIETRMRCLDCELNPEQESVFYKVVSSPMKDEAMKLIQCLRRKGFEDRAILDEMARLYGPHAVVPE